MGELSSTAIPETAPKMQAGKQEHLKKADVLQSTTEAMNKASLERHVRELSGIGIREAYSEDTSNINKAKEYIVGELIKYGLPQTRNPRQRGFSLQRFTMQSTTVFHKQGALAPVSWFNLKPVVIDGPAATSQPKMPSNEPVEERAKGEAKKCNTDLSINKDKAQHEDGGVSKPPITNPITNNVEATLLKSATISESFKPLDIKALVAALDTSPFIFDHGIKVEGSNIIVRIPGKKYPCKKVILGAHYDCFDGPGANDNATGVATLLEAARILSRHDFEYTIEIVFFTGEDMVNGDLGSKFYIKQLSEQDKRNIVATFIVDMVGNNQSHKEPKGPEDLDLMYDKYYPDVSKSLTKETSRVINHYVPELKTKISPDSGYDSDDDEFQLEKIPTVYVAEDAAEELVSENSHFNTPKDKPEHIDFNGFFPKAVQGILVSVASKARPIK